MKLMEMIRRIFQWNWKVMNNELKSEQKKRVKNRENHIRKATGYFPVSLHSSALPTG